MHLKTKVIIQIPCYNEADTLPQTLAALPREIEGVDAVEWLVIDDGSIDGTADIARRLGVDHVVRHEHNRGLAQAFRTGLEACLRRGATIIVNTDADNQYNGADIPALLAPILKGQAEFVVGDRGVRSITHFSPVKRALQRIGSFVVRVLSGTQIPDAPSGFRAMHRSVAERLTVFSEYTYTLETLIQAGLSNMKIVSVPIGTNDPTRPSRLIRSIRNYVYRSAVTILRIFMIYRPLRSFLVLSMIFILPGLLLCLRYLVLVLTGGGQGNVQSLILAAICLLVGALIGVTGLVAELISINRKLLQELRLTVLQISRRLDDTDDSTPGPSEKSSVPVKAQP